MVGKQAPATSNGNRGPNFGLPSLGTLINSGALDVPEPDTTLHAIRG